MKNNTTEHIGTSIQARRYNERLLLQVLRRAGEASKADLARKTNLTSTAVGSIIQSLDDAKLIQYGGRRSEGRGQPATMIYLNPKGAFGIGVRLDRDSFETVLVDFDGKILARYVHDCLLPPPAETLDLVCKDISAAVGVLSAAERQRLVGIGLAEPFNLGAWLSELSLPAQRFKAWENAEFAKALEDRTGLQVFNENDGNAAAIAELFYGRGHEFNDFIYLFLGPAIGCGVVIGSDCMRGVTGNAGDIALIPVTPSKLPSAPQTTNRWDLLLSRASLIALGRHLRYSGETVADRSTLQRFIELRHPAVTEWLEDCVDALTPALQSALCVLDVPLVIVDADVDGGLIDLLMCQLSAGLKEISPEARQAPQLIRGSFGADAGAIGAASLPMFFNFSPR